MTILNKLNFIPYKVNSSIVQYSLYLNKKYVETMENKWILVVAALIVLAAVGLYAWYCTSGGRSFAFNVRYNWPKSGQMGVACK
ncbi:hypothetical protein [Streptococcus jiangjianxini]|uniref:hypothetical protein n=1 Tax=Streptococcus jiangjianxini TaxID=3161189 RepID=UPI0032EFA422